MTDYFIQHTSRSVEEGTSYFGPFDSDDAHDYATDAYARLLMSEGGGSVEVVSLSREELERYWVNPPSYWREQLLEALDFDEGVDTLNHLTVERGS